MAITEKQRLARIKNIGGSDAPAILGVDPFRNAYEVWLEKTEKLNDAKKTGTAINLGRIMEVSAILMAQERLGKIIRDRRLMHREYKEWPILAVNTDGILKEKGEPVEAKVTNITNRAPDKDQWGEEGTDEVPERVIVQGTAQMIACEAEVCHVAAIIGGRGFCLFNIRMDNELAKIILDKLHHFWEYNVLKDIPPENLVAPLDTIKRIKRIPQSSVPIEKSVVDKWVEAKENALQCEKIKKAAEAELLQSLGTAEAGTFEGGILTYYETKRKGYTVEETVYRTPRIVKNLLKG